jgi:hypothetical protein
MSVSEIKKDIARLPAGEVAELLSWLANYHSSLWAKKTAGDPAAGRFESLLGELQEEIAEGLERSTRHSGR